MRQKMILLLICYGLLPIDSGFQCEHSHALASPGTSTESLNYCELCPLIKLRSSVVPSLQRETFTLHNNLCFGGRGNECTSFTFLVSHGHSTLAPSSVLSDIFSPSGEELVNQSYSDLIDVPLKVRKRSGRKFCLASTEVVAGEHRSANFIANDPKITTTAEQARIRSAKYWTGKKLPGDWYHPCLIIFRYANHSGGGVTQFRFHNGEVCDWSMSVEGTLNAIITDVIPHEVDHMVRASLVRKPIVRWLDEGCASLMESEQSHAQLRKLAQSLSAQLITPSFLNGKDYPEDPEQLRQLYALGFSLVELLLERNGPHALLKLQQTDDDQIVALQAIYGLSLTDLRRLWLQQHQYRSLQQLKCSDACSIHHTLRPMTCTCQQRQANLLVIWGAHWCSPCRSFWNDYHNNKTFRDLLNEKFHIHFHDFDKQRGLALQQGILGVPTFQFDGQTITGYTSSEDLIKRLGAQPIAVPPLEAMPDNELTPTSPSKIRKPDSPSSRVQEPISVSPPVLQTLESIPPKTKTSQQVTNSETKSIAGDFKRLLIHFVPIGFTALQWTGILGGSFASGGIGALALSLVFRRLTRKTKQTQAVAMDGRTNTHPAPFPRQLDEARELLELRQSEGRVGILDALRGMFLDDEFEKMSNSQTPEITESLKQLCANIDKRVDEVAPLSTHNQ